MTSASKKSEIALDLLTETHGSTFAATYYRDKVIQRPLYLKPTSKDELEPSARDLRQKARQQIKSQKRKTPGKPGPLSAKQKRALQIYKIPKGQQKYEIYVPLHTLWCGYIREVLSLNKPHTEYGKFVEPRSAGPLLTSADYHGALVEVVGSRCTSRVGTKGIVVRDTKSTFEVITMENKLKILPKEHTVFRFEIPLEQDLTPTGDAASEGKQDDLILKPLVFEIHGSSFEHRAPDRATRKFVLHLPDL